MICSPDLQGKKLAKDLEEVEVDDDDGGDVSDEDEALDIDPHDIEHAKERGECFSAVGHQLVAVATLFGCLIN